MEPSFLLSPQWFYQQQHFFFFFLAAVAEGRLRVQGCLEAQNYFSLIINPSYTKMIQVYLNLKEYCHLGRWFSVITVV